MTTFYFGIPLDEDTFHKVISGPAWGIANATPDGPADDVSGCCGDPADCGCDDLHTEYDAMPARVLSHRKGDIVHVKMRVAADSGYDESIVELEDEIGDAFSAVKDEIVYHEPGFLVGDFVETKYGERVEIFATYGDIIWGKAEWSDTPVNYRRDEFI